MKLTYYRDHLPNFRPNFGDELNPYIWPRILPPDFLDEDESELFLGIGSILYTGWPASSKKNIMGSGYGGYGKGKPDLGDGTWNPVFVRGPRTAAALGLPESLAICDGAILLKYLQQPPRGESGRVAFIPHFHSLARGRWAEVCRLAGLDFIDPTDDVETVLGQIRNARFVITEAMHGAIVADTLRTPWIAMQPLHPENRMKWQDWADSVSVELRWQRLLPSSVMEAFITTTKTKKKFGPRGYAFNESLYTAPFNAVLRYACARHLAWVARQEPQLSRDAVIDAVADRAMHAVKDFAAGRARG